MFDIGAYGGQRRRIVPRLGNIVEADDRPVFAGHYAAIDQSAGRSYRDDVVIAKYRRWRPRRDQRTFDRLRSAPAGRSARENQTVIYRESGFRERITPARLAFPVRCHRRIAAEKADAPIAEPQEMGDCLARARAIVRTHIG